MRLKPAAVLTLGIMSTTLAGCATVLNGRTQTIQFTSNPPGALVEIDDGISLRTPVEVRLARKRDHRIRITLDGYEEAHATLASRADWAVLLAAYGTVPAGVVLYSQLYLGTRAFIPGWSLFCAVVSTPGLLADAYLGGMWRLAPELVSVALIPIRNRPATPHSAQATGPGERGQLRVSWSPAPVRVAGYHVYLARLPDGALLQAASVLADTISVKLSEVNGRPIEAGISYRAVVRAVSLDEPPHEGASLLDENVTAAPLPAP
jgi:hypothetical protein